MSCQQIQQYRILHVQADGDQADLLFFRLVTRRKSTSKGVTPFRPTTYFRVDQGHNDIIVARMSTLLMHSVAPPISQSTENFN